MSGMSKMEREFVIQALAEIKNFIDNLPIDKDTAEYHMFIFNIHRLQRLARESR